jgi:hypothetical protein
MTQMQEEPFSFGDFVETVAQIAGAVVAIAAAIPSAGASLVALVPSMVALADTVMAQAEPMAKQVLSGTVPDTSKLETAYKKVGKDFSAVIAAGKTIVDFVALIQRLTDSKTPENAKHVELVQRGVEQSYQLMAARNRVALSQQRIDASHARSASARALAQAAKDLEDRIQADAESVKQAGLLAISVAQSSAGTLLGMAFRAQRSVEIYTLQSESDNLRLDAGFLNPEIWRAYFEDQMGDGELASALTGSWSGLLHPVGLQNDYLAFFDGPHDQDVFFRAFQPGDPEFEALTTIGRFNFTIAAKAIPTGRADAKARTVRLALVGASHPSGAISCEVRHGPRYEQRRADGSVTVQDLQSRISTRRALLVPLAADDGGAVDLPLTAPLSLAFWGRGIGGDYEVSIVGSTDNAGVDLSGLSQIQVAIGYQFLHSPPPSSPGDLFGGRSGGTSIRS